MALSVRQIRAFDAVARTESFTAAADHLNLTQAAVSMLIRQFETELGLPVFMRTGRGAHLTEFGGHIRPTVARVLTDLQNIVDSAADLRSLRRGHLRIAVTQILASCWLPSVLSAFRSQYPDVEVSVVDTTGDRVMETVASGEAEIGLGPERAVMPGLTRTFLWQIAMQYVVSRHSPHAQKGVPLDPEALLQNRWIVYSEDFSNLLDQALLTGPGLHDHSGLRVRGLMTALALVGTENFVTAAPAYAGVLADVFDVRFLDMNGDAARRRFFLYARAGHEISPGAAAFLDLAKTSGPVGATP